MKKTAKRKYEEPADDATEAQAPEEFRHTPRRFKRVGRSLLPVATAADLAPEKTKVRISIMLDLDVLNHFKARAAAPDAAPYQTQINNELRRVMERDRGADPLPFAALVNDSRFIEAVAEKVRARGR